MVYAKVKMPASTGGFFVEFYDTHVVRYNDVIGVVFGFRAQI